MPHRSFTPAADRWFLALVALLPLHTVSVRWWIAWKPWLVVLVVVATLHLVDGFRTRTWPWHRRLSIGLATFLAAAAASWSGEAPERFSRLLLALGVGGLVMLVTARQWSRPGMADRLLRVAFWSAAALAVSAFVVSLLAAGTFGAAAIDAADRLPLFERVTKPAYLDEGFVAITNWHQDPGYAAAWMNLWAGLALFASLRGLGSGRRWLDAAVIGGLWMGVFMTLSRTGAWGSLVVAAAILWRHRGPGLRRAATLLAASVAWGILLIAAVWALDRPGVGGDLGEGISFRIAQGLSLGAGGGVAGEGGGEVDYRDEVWPYYWRAFLDHPVRGIGLGTGWDADGVQEPHNLVLELLGEMGMIGLAGFAVLVGTVLRTGRNPLGRTALVIALSAAMTQTVLFEATWWFAAGLTVGSPEDDP